MLSQNEALRVRKSSAVAGVSTSALSGAASSTSSGKKRREADLTLPGFETAGLAIIDDGLQRPVRHHSGHLSFDMTPPASRGGFMAAHRHSVLVRVLRRTAIGGSLLAIVLICAATLLNPFKRLPGDVSISGVGVEGTKVTVDSPKITGTQKDGRSFEIKAQTGIQDITDPNTIELNGIDSRLGAADASTTLVRAARGIYDSLHDKMTLEGDIQIKSSTGYDLRLKTARIDFKSGGLVSEEPVKVLFDGGTIAAKQLDVSDNGHKVSFDGEVTSMIENGAGETETNGALTERIR